jgi:hypothetical protein
MWRFYLSVSAASFRAGTNDVWQVLMSPNRQRAPARVASVSSPAPQSSQLQQAS